MTAQQRQKDREQRLITANQVIEAIASCGRRFLSTNSDLRVPHDNPRYSRFVFHNGKLWYVDKYRESRIYVHHDPPVRLDWSWKFSDGGTILRVCKMLRDHVTKGTPINPLYFAPVCTYWGYGEDMAVLYEKVTSIVARTQQQVEVSEACR